MSSESDEGVGVKMLADHLVQVKSQYENQVNELTKKLEQLELEKKNMERDYRQMEKELDSKRVEILNMKRANVAQYAIEERENWKAMLQQQKSENKRLQTTVDSLKEQVQELEIKVEEKENASSDKMDSFPEFTKETIETELNNNDEMKDNEMKDESSISLEGTFSELEIEIKQLLKELDSLRHEKEEYERVIEEAKKTNVKVTEQFILKVDTLEHNHQERENALLASIEALKLKLDLELEKKWELLQEVEDEEAEESQRGGFISYLWG